jgi:membrane associated rhomboid family serine protease
MGFEDRDYSRNNASGGGLSQYSMITILIGINVIVFVLDMFFEGRLASQLALSTETWYFPWTWMTHGFAHAPLRSEIGIWHIAGNMLTLYFLGRPIEQRLGRWEFLKFYLLALLAGGAGFYLVNLLSGWPPASVLGASGAVSGVVALFIFYYPRQTLLIWGILPVPAWLLGVIMLLMNLKYALVPGSGISWEAHLAGAAFGVAYFYFGWNFSGLQMPKSIANGISRSGALKIHNPDARDPNEKLTQQADAILEKINIQGEDSLTGRERKVLKRYSEMVRRQRQ